MNKQPKRVTQQDVARAAGVHRSSVCLAMQNHPNIPVATRERIQEIARQLGYQPDPMLSALAVYRRQQSPRVFQGTLAWLGNTLPHYDWRKIPIFQQNYEGAVACAQSHGYTVEVFDLQTPDISPQRMAGILRSRNITGIFVAPQPKPYATLDFPWEHFSAVTFGFTLLQPLLHCVAATQYRATLQTMQRMRNLGYRRIAFASSLTQDERVDHNCLAAYLAEMAIHGEEPHVTPLKPGWTTPENLSAWMREVRPEAAVISLDVQDMLIEAGFRFPRDLAIACPMMFEPDGPLAGVCENSRLVGEASADFLVAMIQRGERGVPPVPQRLLIEGAWVPGKTLPPFRPETKPKAASRSRKSRKA
ncbi:MAG: LacI family DNA-binding transcriptional regulator [Verrucomicrobia bacterium]|nr:LacI family DNA-binding transcriptional regulator [Verrucomicrobiota bacterium]TXI78460.1 MAG: LacI family transcriptional regulator [Cupriavidus sp.]